MRSTPKCLNCTKGTYCGKNRKGEVQFSCKSSFCVFEPIVPNPFHKIIIEEYKKNGADIRR